jgi:hypothetical protein
MKIRYSIFALIVVGIISDVSCKKDDAPNNSATYVRAKFDGVLKTFDAQAFFTITDMSITQGQGGPFTLTITATGSNQNLGINLWSASNDFAAGKVYDHEPVEVMPSSYSYNAIAYVPDLGNTDVSNVYSSSPLDDNAVEMMECKITEMTSTHIKGTFKGNVYQNVLDNAQKIVVTEGEFFVKKLQ